MCEQRFGALNGKNILFFSPAFFGYENKIADKMRKLGAKADVFDVRSVKKAWQRALLKINPQLFDRKTEAYYADIFSKVWHNRYDYVVIVKCDMPTERVLSLLRRHFREAEFCLHMWDSVKNIPNIKKKFRYFDYISSFDRNDCRRYPQFHFRPLFYCDEYRKEPGMGGFEYDLCFIGTIHSDRWKILKELRSQAEKKGMRVYYYPYLQSKFIYLFYKLVKPEFWDTDMSEFRFEKISSEETAARVNQSKTVIDIQHPGQTGLTVRTIEMAGMNKKLITTNADIKNYDFYHEKNIQVIDRKNPVLGEVSDSKYEQPDKRVYEKYSLESWIYDVLGIKTTVKKEWDEKET